MGAVQALAVWQQCDKSSISPRWYTKIFPCLLLVLVVHAPGLVLVHALCVDLFDVQGMSLLMHWFCNYDVLGLVLVKVHVVNVVVLVCKPSSGYVKK